MYECPELRVSMDKQHESPPMSTKSRVPCSLNKVKRRSGRGFHSASRYYAYGSALRLINEKRKKQKLERMARETAREEFQNERVRSTRVLNDDRPRRKFRGYGYGSEPYVEVKPAPMHQEPRFKNKIEEMIWRSKKN